MGHEFEGHDEVEIDASPEQVWDAITTGEGLDSWFMGRNEVDPGAGGAVRTAFGAYTPESRIVAWEPGRRFVYRSSTADDGRFIAYEFRIEAREGGAVLRIVSSGFIPGDDWEDEYDAMTKGGAMFLRTLAAYLAHFPGRAATPLTVFGPPVSDWPRSWSAVHRALGLDGPPTIGDRVRLDLEGTGPVEGTVYFVNADTLGIRTGDALYRLLRGIHGAFVASHHLFTAPGRGDPSADVERAWLARVSI